MITSDDAIALLSPDGLLPDDIVNRLAPVGFEQPKQCLKLLRSLSASDRDRDQLTRLLPNLFRALAETPDADRSLKNFSRLTETLSDRAGFFEALCDNPRMIEILVRLFIGSQFLSELLFRDPEHLTRLAEDRGLAEFKSREQFIEEIRDELQCPATVSLLKERLRTAHQSQILRIAACDTFGLMDLKTVTNQLSLLADALVQLSLENVFRFQNVPTSGFAVIAFGKQGGVELNYSSDIDLVFVCADSAERYQSVAPKVIHVLSDRTAGGFLYRVDMRLRPWGNSGPLVTTGEAYQRYFDGPAQLWERQALLKARTIAGDYKFGDRLLHELKSHAFDVDPDLVRRNIAHMKAQIEDKEVRSQTLNGSVKSGPGGIRDIEFLVQYLQLVHGRQAPHIRRVGTIDALIHLSEANLIHAEEFRVLSTAYVIFRTIEHSLQLMHNQPEYALPTSERELAYLAGRLDFPNVDVFRAQYQKHTQAVREIFDRHVRCFSASTTSKTPATATDSHQEQSANTDDVTVRSEPLLRRLDESHVVAMDVQPLSESMDAVTIVGFDQLGDLPMICGLLYAYGFDIVSGRADTLEFATNSLGYREFVNRFQVRRAWRTTDDSSNCWSQFLGDLNSLLLMSIQGDLRGANAQLIRRLSKTIASQPDPADPLLPVDVTISHDRQRRATVLEIGGTDVPGFLFELTNAISMNGLSIEKMIVQTDRDRVCDTLYVVDPRGDRLLDETQQMQLRAAVVLIKHFTHLLPHAPQPEAALHHFREMLMQLFEQPDWIEQLQTLHQPKVLAALARLLGISDFLWEDFLRLQHENLFPIVTDIQGLHDPVTTTNLRAELEEELTDASPAQRQASLNQFKDRAMMRVDMRHILGLQTEFGSFSRELTAVAEVVVQSATELCLEELTCMHGVPSRANGSPAGLVVCALGKFGGSELGYASDIELMFVYDEEGRTNGRQPISNIDFYQKLVENFRQAIFARQKRIFEIDLRLRPYGNAGSLAVSRSAFRDYFHRSGPAWPFERQALVKLRPVFGHVSSQQSMIELRDELVYCGDRFDISSMRAMRERQIRKHVEPGTFHAKLSPGGLVDCEYFVQGMQITYGHLSAEIRNPNTRMALKGLEQHGLLSRKQRIQLRDAYRFLRRLIDALRMVRGDATDLTIPDYPSEQFDFLARRIGIPHDQLHAEIERQTCCVIELLMNFEDLISQ